MKNFIYSLVFLVFITSLSFAEVIKSGSFQATSDGVNVTLRWLTEDETNVTSYEVERRSGSEGDFVIIGTLDTKGASLYEFVDYSALRKATGIYQYRIKIVFSNSTIAYSQTVTVSHTVSGVRRTWGSIKAMFR
jgi:hypothetical protein